MQKYREYIHLTYGVEPDVVIVVIIGPRPKGEPVSYLFESGFGVRVVYEYVNVDVLKMSDDDLLAGDNRMGLVLYAMKKARLSGDDEGMKFRYLKELSRLWAQRKWAREDKRMILLALDYQMQLSDRGYRRQLADYVDELTEAAGKEERKVYVSIFEEVYTEKGMQKGMAQGRAGLSPQHAPHGAFRRQRCRIHRLAAQRGRVVGGLLKLACRSRRTPGRKGSKKAARRPHHRAAC
ncbi:MAG: hypothetical protein LBR38_01535 [Synergistaceae bacterium]|jgi:hypothetical protein|nr:hypothetical protein [Synergistaceae bacterium]